MISLAAAFIRADKRRIGAVFAVLALALSSFLLLMTSTMASKAHVAGTLQANWRGNYDILVRPQDTQTPEEHERGIVASNFLSGIYGGISLAQLKEIRSLAHVEVAAPIAMIGAIDNALWPHINIPVPDHLQGMRAIVKREGATVSSRGGKYSLTDEDMYYYFTPNSTVPSWEDGSIYEEAPGQNHKKVCGTPSEQEIPLVCEGDLSTTYSLFAPRLEHYLLLAAVDPEAEATISGLDTAITAGRYLRAHETAGRYSQTITDGPHLAGTFLPVLLSTHLGRVDLRSHVEASVLPSHIADDVYTRGFTNTPSFNPDVIEEITNAQQIATWQADIATDTYWQDFLRQHPPSQRNTDGRRAVSAGDQAALGVDYIDAGTLIPMRFATVGPLTYRPADDASGALVATSRPASFNGTHVPNPGSLAPQFREKFTFASPPDLYLDPIGHFDPAAIAETGSQPANSDVAEAMGAGDEYKSDNASQRNVFLGSAPLGTYQESDIRLAADPTAYYSPDLNLQGYTLSPPMLITSLDAYLDAFSGSEDPGVAATVKAPISAVRVRVAGVEEMSDVSAEKIRSVAEQIAQRTGLSVDIMTGASVSHQRILLQGEGEEGDMLVVDELWAKKGVLTTISHALDHKTLLLATLIVISALFTVAIGISAFLRSHATDFRTLTTLGWARTHLTRFQLAIIVLVAGSAGVVAGLLSLVLAQVFGLTLPLWQAALALPMALLVTLLAASPHLARGQRASKTSSRLSKPHTRTRMHARKRIAGAPSPAALGFSQLRMRPGRTATAAFAIVLAVASLSFTAAILAQFRGNLVGSVLGEVVSVQIRDADVFAISALAAMGIACVAVASWISAVEDAPTYATLRALGWRNGMIARAIIGQNLILGAAGCLVAGAVTSTVLATIGSLNAHTLLVIATACGAYCASVVALGSLPALAFLRRALAH